MANIGWVGLGHMGLPMTLNLLQAGHRVTGFDLQPESMEKLTKAGGQVANTISDLAKNQDILITMLQTGEQVQSVCLGTDGLFANASPKTLFIDCSSIDVKASRLVTKAAQDAGLEAIDAPVSGGTAGAKLAKLTFMVGGDALAFEKAKPILSAMGANIFHAGSAGSGQIAKICNNMILGISMIAVSEAFILAEQLGLSADKLFEIVSAASGQCWVMSNYVPVPGVLPQVPANNDYKAGFTAAMMLKDLQLSQSSAEELGVSTPLGAAATALYHDFVQKKSKELDFSAIIQLLRDE